MLPFLFNACGPNGLYGLNEVGVLSSATVQLKKCENQLISDYAVTYHPLLKTNCNQCHSNAHGSVDARVSYNAFRAKGEQLIDFQATHPHGGNSINLTNEIANVQASWKAATDAYSQCLAENPDEQVSTGVPFDVIDKPLTAITSTFKEYSWDLNLDSKDRAGEVKATFRIEAHLYSYMGNVVGLEFRNPSIQLATGQTAITLEAIRFTVNGQLQTTASTYLPVSMVVSGTTKTMLAPGLGTTFIEVAAPSATTTVGFLFDTLKVN